VQGWLSTEIEVETGQLSASDWARLVWGLLWRAGVLALLGASIALGIGSVAAQLSGPSPAPLGSALVRLAAGAAGLAALPLYLRWLLHARFGTLRLALIRTSKRS